MNIEVLAIRNTCVVLSSGGSRSLTGRGSVDRDNRDEGVVPNWIMESPNLKFWRNTIFR